MMDGEFICLNMNKGLTSTSQWGIVLPMLKNTQQKIGRKKLMSVMQNEIIRENLLDKHYDLLIEEGWPEDQVETWDEAARRTHEEWERMS